MSVQIHDHLRDHLPDLYESDCIFDKFECAVSGDGNHFMTGSYNGEFHIYDRYGRSDVSLSPNLAVRRPGRGSSLPQQMLAQQLARMPAAGQYEALDFTKKVLQTSWHPSANEVAVAIRNNLYVYST